MNIHHGLGKSGTVQFMIECTREEAEKLITTLEWDAFGPANDLRVYIQSILNREPGIK